MKWTTLVNTSHVMRIDLLKHFEKIKQNSLVNQASLWLAILILTLSFASLLYNYFFTQFPVPNYFPQNAFGIFISLLLMYCGIRIYLGHRSKWTHTFLYFVIYYLVLSVITVATMAAQLTPFQTIDKLLIILDNWLGYDTIYMLDALSNYQALHSLLIYAYAFIVIELALLPPALSILKQFNALNQFFFCMLLSALLGFSFYYFFPTTAPASNFSSPLFTESQIATGLKFHQIHNYMSVTTLDGGLVAMPSFHIIWAILCQVSVRQYKTLWYILLPINSLLVVSCIILGWHYLVDLFGSIIIVGICYWAYCHLQCRQSA